MCPFYSWNKRWNVNNSATNYKTKHCFLKKSYEIPFYNYYNLISITKIKTKLKSFFAQTCAFWFLTQKCVNAGEQKSPKQLFRDGAFLRCQRLLKAYLHVIFIVISMWNLNVKSKLHENETLLTIWNN